MATFIPVSSSGIKLRGGYSREGSHQSVSVWGFEGEKPPRISIRDLTPHLPNTVIVGLVVVKQSIKSFPDKKNPGSMFHKFSFTLRDSSSDYINVNVWGSEMFITSLFNSFKINDVVELFNCQISSKPGGETEEKWRPWTPSPYQLAVSESHSSLNIYNGMDYSEFSSLAHVPLRSSNDYYTLTDILSNGMTIDGSHVNILAVIRSVGAPKDMTSKTGKPLKKCEVKLMDDGCNSFSLLIWDTELIDLALSWTPKENIIFAVDVKVGFDQYRNTMTASCTSKTIVTTNPDCPEAHHLYQYTQSVDLDNQDDGWEKPGSTDLQSITDVYTICQMKQLKWSSGDISTNKTSGSCCMGITYAYLTTIDIDQTSSTCVTYRCSQCKFRIPQESIMCCNHSCSSLTSGGFSSELTFDLSISLSDHTDMIEYVRLNGRAASDLLHISPADFLQMSDEQKTELKSSLLLEKFKVYFKSTTFAEQKSAVRVLNIELADPMEALSHANV